jgi:hypothetical protein
MEQFVGLDVRVPPAGFRRSGELRAQGGDLAFRFRRPTDGVAGNGLASARSRRTTPGLIG